MINLLFFSTGRQAGRLSPWGQSFEGTLRKTFLSRLVKSFFFLSVSHSRFVSNSRPGRTGIFSWVWAPVPASPLIHDQSLRCFGVICIFWTIPKNLFPFFQKRFLRSPTA